MGIEDLGRTDLIRACMFFRVRLAGLTATQSEHSTNGADGSVRNAHREAFPADMVIAAPACDAAHSPTRRDRKENVMGDLVVRHYPTKLFLKAADHTYVECGTGAKGWSCWGGKTGGDYLRSAPGSTLRADAIAQPNERARIKCYLINGVCHQAANRILFPAGLTVDGARGYGLSVTLFGVYGRPGGLMCKAPFDKHPTVTGDLPQCVGQATTIREQGVSYNADRLDYTDEKYMAQVNALYDVGEAAASESTEAAFEFQMQHFKLLLDHKFGGPASLPLERPQYERLLDVRERFERERLGAEEALSASRDGMAFVAEFDRLTLKFQADVAEVLEPRSYQALLNLPPDERIVLSDPEIVERTYGRTDFNGGAS